MTRPSRAWLAVVCSAWGCFALIAFTIWSAELSGAAPDTSVEPAASVEPATSSPATSSPVAPSPVAPSPVAPLPVAAESLPAHAQAAAFIGVTSCAASGCHGASSVDLGFAREQPPPWRSAYIVWATKDPHAKAYQALRGELAAHIVRKLDRVPAGGEVKPYEDRRCLSCHATNDAAHVSLAGPADKAQPHRAPQAWLDAGHLADGVSCESCHGAAKHWVGEHFLSAAPDAKRRYAELGMIDTDDVAVQAEACVGCHVGRRAEGDVRDMNHDMIAAGHPSLNFEFAAYKARMPRHWALPQESTALAERESKSWVVGQLTAAAAQLRLSADRAAPAAKNLVTTPWPEFSEFDCYRCHHALRSGPTADATDQQRMALARKKTAGEKVGDRLWGTWGSWHTAQALGLIDAATSGDLAKLQQESSNPFVSAAELEKRSEALRECAAKLEEAAREAAAAPAGDGGESLTKLGEVAAKVATGTLSWEHATQAYLGCVALYRADRAAAGRPLGAADDEVGAILKKLFEALRFDDSQTRRFNSPADYERTEVKKLFEQLAAAAKKGA